MKKIKQQHIIINNQEDEDASAYPLYPDAEQIYNRQKKDGRPHQANNAGTASAPKKISGCQNTQGFPQR